MTSLRYGIIGFGGIALNRIAKEGFGLDRSRFSATHGVELVAATSPSGRFRPQAEELGLEWCASVEALLAYPGLDAVFVTSPNSLHFMHARDALAAGKHCIIEKPITTDIAAAEELDQIARKKNLSVTVNHMMVHNVFNRAAQNAIRDGAIGVLGDLVLHLEFLYGSTVEEASSWRCSQPQERGGPIGDVGSHCLYMAEFLSGQEIVSITAVAEPRVLDIVVENGAVISFTTASGLRGSIRVSFNAGRGGVLGTILNLGFEAYGSEAVLRSYGTLFQLSGHADEPFQQRLELETRDRRVEVTPEEPVRNIYRAVIEEHADSIRNKKPMRIRDAIHNLRLVLAAYESLGAQGAPIDI